jgi:hypothetical protein
MGDSMASAPRERSEPELGTPCETSATNVPETSVTFRDECDTT